MAPRGAREIAVTALLLATTDGCASGPADESGEADEQFSLLTHCGIHELTHDGTWYARSVGPLDDGQGHPPEGWDDPSQEGRLLVDGDTAVFTDDAGHREEFVLRKGATGPLTPCS